MIIDVLKSEDATARDCSSLRTCLIGGSATPETLLKEFKTTFGMDGVVHGYGQTENTGTSITQDAGEPLRPDTIGRPVCTVQAKVVDLNADEELPAGQKGELLLRSDNIVPEYWNREDLNDEAFIDEWFHTGDVVYRDEGGYFHYVDRADDIIISGGEKVSPAAVESVLQEMPDIETVAVFGTPHDRWGEVVTAATVTSTRLTEAEIEEFCDKRTDLAGYKKPRRILFVEEIPRTPSQKVDKSALADRFD